MAVVFALPFPLLLSLKLNQMRRPFRPQQPRQGEDKPPHSSPACKNPTPPIEPFRLTSAHQSPTIIKIKAGLQEGLLAMQTACHQGGSMRIRKAVLPVAGLGTRVLPASKVIPKEMLPLVDKPTLQYIVEEAVAAGVEEIIFVTSRSKRSIEDHFDVFPELETVLERKGKHQKLEELRRVETMATYTSVRQPEARGLGHAVLCAKELVGDEPFIVMLGDILIPPETPCLPGLIKVYEQYQGSVLSLVPLPPEIIPTYG